MSLAYEGDVHGSVHSAGADPDQAAAHLREFSATLNVPGRNMYGSSDSRY